MSDDGVVVFVGLGSNLQDPPHQVRSALKELDGIPRTRLLERSRLYRSPPLGPPGQPDYVNAVARLHTVLSPVELLDALQALERRHGRERAERWGPRTLDLDILFYGERHIDSARLQVPHPEILRRPFVLVPLHEIAPSLRVPGWGRVADHLGAVDADGRRTVTPIADG